MSRDREIKFRALYDDMGGGWKYGMLIYEGDVPRIQQKGTMLFYTCLKGTEGQFTGLRDKGGEETYEGDIIDTWPFYKHQGNCKGKNRYQKIVFEHGSFMPEKFDFGWEGEGTIRVENCTIVGNIHQHPHLLKQ